MHTLSHEDSAHRVLQYWTELFCRFIGFECLNRLYTFICQNTHLYKYPCNHNNLGLKWKQTTGKENMHNSILDPGQLLKWQQSNIPEVCHSLKKCYKKNLTALDQCWVSYFQKVIDYYYY